MGTGESIVLFESDLHAHHRAGLNSPDWWMPDHGAYAKWGIVQRELYEARAEILERIGAVDIHVINGDAFDGRGECAGGTELLADPSWENQIANAEASLRIVRFRGDPKRLLIRGTPYHVGWDADYEDALASHLQAKIKDHGFFSAGGVMFDCKHKLGTSAVPYGRATPLAREYIWNLLWHERMEQPRAQVVIRSHVHSYNFVGGKNYLAMSTPGLQAAGTKYGGRQCSGTIDWGLVVFHCAGGQFDWHAYLADLKANKVEAIKW